MSHAIKGTKFSQLLKNVSVKRFKADNNDGIDPAHAQSGIRVYKHHLLKALVQLPRNIADHAIAHFNPYFVLFHCTIRFVQRELLKLAIFILSVIYRRKA